MPHGAVVTLKGDLEHALASARQFTFLPPVEPYSRKEPIILALTGTNSQPCLVKAGPPRPPPSLPHPVLPSWLFPRRPQGFQANCQTTRCWDWLSGTLPPLYSSNSSPCVAALLWAPSLEGKAPMAASACYASTCRGIHLKPPSTVCVYLGHAEEPRAMSGAAFQNSL